MGKVKLKDIIILLPGITGSVLTKNGKVIWDASYKAILKAIINPSIFDELRLKNDDAEINDLGDGIRATHIANDFHLLPGFCKIDGYTGLRQMISRNFEIIEGSHDILKPANYFEFPYDWRRDNRYSARKLKEFVEERLTLWRKHTGLNNAKVILIGHSMGGLVSRYYLEVLEGWPKCKALITFGTPYRGSVNSVDALVNGVKKLHIDLTEVMRTFTSVYQLLPIYPVLDTGNGFARVNEVNTLPNLPAEKALEGISFLREIEKKVEEHRNIPDYLNNGYKIIPIVGTRQKTQQSASFTNGTLRVFNEPPDIVPVFLSDGDGTVPRVSAIPIELSSEFRDTYIAEKHASLQNNHELLNRISERLKVMQATTELSAIRGSEPTPELAGQPALSLELDEVYLADNPVEIRAALFNMKEPAGGLAVRIIPVEPSKMISNTEITLIQKDVNYFGQIGKLDPGAYRAELFAPDNPEPTPVHDVFLVI
jgi:hypothetical protein